VKSPPVEIFKAQLDTALSNLLSLTLFEQGGWTRQSQESPSNLSDPVNETLFKPVVTSNKSVKRQKPSSSVLYIDDEAKTFLSILMDSPMPQCPQLRAPTNLGKTDEQNSQKLGDLGVK